MSTVRVCGESEEWKLVVVSVGGWSGWCRSLVLEEAEPSWRESRRENGTCCQLNRQNGTAAWTVTAPLREGGSEVEEWAGWSPRWVRQKDPGLQSGKRVGNPKKALKDVER